MIFLLFAVLFAALPTLFYGACILAGVWLIVRVLA